MVSPAPALPDERQSLILERLLRDGRVMAAALAAEFGTSEDTIRRDLRELAAAGRCRRVYGGALPLAPTAPLAKRQTTGREAKQALARMAAGLVASGQVVIIDSGSTNVAIAEALPQHLELTVVTNAPGVAAVLATRSRMRVVMLGGLVHPEIGACFGARALRDLEGLRADTAFVGACGFAAELGLTAFHPEEAAFKARLIAASERVVLALTRDKIGTAAPFAVAGPEAFHDLVVPAGVVLDGLPVDHLRIHRA